MEEQINIDFYKRPVYKNQSNRPINESKQFSHLNELTKYLQHHHDINKIDRFAIYDKHNGTNIIEGLSDIIEYYYIAESFQINEVKTRAIEIINKKLELYGSKKHGPIEKKLTCKYIYNSKIYDIEFDCNCDKLMKIFEDSLKEISNKLEFLSQSVVDDEPIEFKVYLHYIKYLNDLIANYGVYHKDRIKIVDTIYTIHNYILNNVSLYFDYIPKSSIINMDNLDYLLELVSTPNQSKLIQLVEIDSWCRKDGTMNWDIIGYLEKICIKHGLRDVFSDKVKAYMNYIYDSKQNGHKYSRL